MRNLKKVLALVLALVMSLSLITIANAADFSDDADISYDEAVDVMVAAGIINGVGNNSFDPNGTLTREQAAKLITYMLLGENSEKLGIETSSFKDVAVTRWSAPAIEYCTSLGIIDGAGDGNFYPAGRLTGYAFAKMLLTAIGYDSQIEKFVGNGWTIPVATIGMDVSLHNGMEKMFGNAELSRQEAAQMALNAIKAPLVQYPNKGNSITVGGTVVDFTAREAEYVTTTLAKEQRISKAQLTNSKDYTVELGEKYLPKLVLDDEQIDAFGRPSYTWSYDKKEIGTYINSDLLSGEYTEAVDGKTVYGDIGSAVMNDKNLKLTVFVDGEVSDVIDEDDIAKTNTKDLDKTGNGVLTQVFVDTDTADVTIAIINTYLAKTDDYNEKKETLAVTEYGYTPIDSKYSSVKALKLEDFESITGYEDGDFVLLTIAKGEVQSIEDAETVSEVVLNAFSKGKSVTTDGTTYKYNEIVVFDEDTLDFYDASNLKDNKYNLYLDSYGYMIGIEKASGKDQYVFITGYDLGNKNTSTKPAEATAIFTDGTMKSIKVNVDKSTFNDDYHATNAPYGEEWGTVPNGKSLENTWYKYTVDEDEIYKLTYAERQFQAVKYKAATGGAEYNYTIEKGKVALGDSPAKAVAAPDNAPSRYSYGNADTNYITVELKTIDDNKDGGAEEVGIINKVKTVTTGVKNANINLYTGLAVNGTGTADNGGLSAAPADGCSEGAYVLYNDKNYIIAAVVVGKDRGTSTNYAYLQGEPSLEKYSGEYFWTMDAVIGGKKTEITIEGELDTAIFDANNAVRTNGIYELSYNANGNVVEIAAVAGDNVDSFDPNTTEYVQDDFDGAAVDLTAKGSTLWVTNDTANRGFALDEDCPAVVVVFDGAGDIDEVNEYSTVAKAIKALSSEGEDYEGELHILFKDGVATSVILTDVAEEDEKEPSGTVEWIDKDASNNYADPTYYVENGTTPTNVEDEIYAMLVAEKCTDIIYDSVDGWTFTKSNGMTVKNQDIDAVQVYKVSFATDEVTIDGVKFAILSADKTYAAKNAAVTLTISAKGTVTTGGVAATITPTAKNGGNVAVAGTPAMVAGVMADGTSGTPVSDGTTAVAGKLTTVATKSPDVRYTVTITIDNTTPCDNDVAIVGP